MHLKEPVEVLTAWQSVAEQLLETKLSLPTQAMSMSVLKCGLLDGRMWHHGKALPAGQTAQVTKSTECSLTTNRRDIRRQQGESDSIVSTLMWSKRAVVLSSRRGIVTLCCVMLRFLLSTAAATQMAANVALVHNICGGVWTCHTLAAFASQHLLTSNQF